MDNFRKVIGLILIIAIGIWSVFIAVSNPDMTEARLLITYWKEYIICVVVGLIGLYLVKS